METTSGDKIVNRLVISSKYELNPETIEILFYSLIITVISLAFQQLADSNAAISTDGDGE